jgi:predicted MFS family arabinose efflux permease
MSASPQIHSRVAAHVFPALLVAAVGAQLVDKLTLDLVTLTGAAAGLSAAAISLLVAAQSAAWLLVSLPAGVLADRFSRRTLMAVGGLLIMVGSGLAAAILHLASPGIWLGAASFVAASGCVIVALSAMVMLPQVVPSTGIPRANARIELGRAIFTLGAPVLAGWLVARGQSSTGLLLCAAIGLAVWLATLRLPQDRVLVKPRESIMASLRAGTGFVARHPALRPVALCAIFWNMGFFGLMAIIAPAALGLYGLNPQTIGLAGSAYGAGLILGAALAPMLVARFTTGTLLVFGPAGSFGAALMLALAPASSGFAALALAFFLFGFGPMLWLIVQTSLRQVVTPPDMLGRVSATITTAIYGVRPIGALLIGAVATQAGYATALWAIALLFGLSLAAILASAMPGLRRLEDVALAAE